MTDWGAPIDLYCERFDAGLFAEPFNAISNLGFVLGGLWLASNLQRFTSPHRPHWSLEVLAGLMVLIGICSGAFHVFAVKWARLLDDLSIAAFVYFFVVAYAHHVLDFGWNFAWIAAPAFWCFSVIAAEPFDPGDFNGSVAYFPTLVGLALMAAGLVARGRRGAAVLVLAAVVFCASLYFRTVDLAWCPRWPWGTHWAWHLLNAVVLTLTVLGLARGIPRPSGQA